MQFFDSYATHKRLTLVGGTAVLLVIIVIFLWSRKITPSTPLSAVAVITEATHKAGGVNYLAEYDEHFSRIINGISETYSYKLLEAKKDLNWKRETYLNDITLFEAFLRNDIGFFHCQTYPERLCTQYVSSTSKNIVLTRDASLAGLNLWEQKNIFQTSVSREDITVGALSRSATCVSYVFNPTAVTDNDMTALMNAIGDPSAISTGSALALQAWIQQYDARVCFDDETGIVLRHQEILRQRFPSSRDNKMVEYASEDMQTITRLRLNPLLPAEAFSTTSIR